MTMLTRNFIENIRSKNGQTMYWVQLYTDWCAAILQPNCHLDSSSIWCYRTPTCTNMLTLKCPLFIIIINKYYYCAVESKKLQEHLTTKKNKTNDSVTWVKNRSQTVRDQTSGLSFKGDQRLHMKITKIRDYASRQSVCPVTQTYNHLRNLQHNLPTTLKTLADSEKFQQIQDAED